MDVNLHTMMLQNVPSIELNRRLLQNEINSRRVAQILVEASQPDLDLLPVRNRSRTTHYAEPPDPYDATSTAVNRSADEYWPAVTTARYGGGDVIPRPAGANASGSVNSNLARNRLLRNSSRPTLNQITPSTANGSMTEDNSATTIINRTANSVTAASTWNLSSVSSSANRTMSTEEKRSDSINMTLAPADSPTSQSIYCPAIPPELRE